MVRKPPSCMIPFFKPPPYMYVADHGCKRAALRAEAPAGRAGDGLLEAVIGEDGDEDDKIGEERV